MQKIYYDTEQNKEVVDINGTLTIEEINQQCGGDFSDVTEQRIAQATQDMQDAQVTDATEALIQGKIRELAIAALQTEKKLDISGKIIAQPIKEGS